MAKPSSSSSTNKSNNNNPDENTIDLTGSNEQTIDLTMEIDTKNNDTNKSMVIF